VASLYGVAELYCNRCLVARAYRRLQGFHTLLKSRRDRLVVLVAACTVVYQGTAPLDLERGYGATGSAVHEGRRQTIRCEELADDG
jgi:hypothetical protein